MYNLKRPVSVSISEEALCHRLSYGTVSLQLTWLVFSYGSLFNQSFASVPLFHHLKLECLHTHPPPLPTPGMLTYASPPPSHPYPTSQTHSGSTCVLWDPGQDTVHPWTPAGRSQSTWAPSGCPLRSWRTWGDRGFESRNRADTSFPEKRDRDILK